ncbi:MAG: hypothetical protein ACTIJJ_05690 [Galactobacter sp.]
MHTTISTTTETSSLPPERPAQIRLEAKVEHLVEALEFYSTEASRITAEVSPSVDPITWGSAQGMASVIQTIRKDVAALVEALAVETSEVAA